MTSTCSDRFQCPEAAEADAGEAPSTGSNRGDAGFRIDAVCGPSSGIVSADAHVDERRRHFNIRMAPKLMDPG